MYENVYVCSRLETSRCLVLTTDLDNEDAALLFNRRGRQFFDFNNRMPRDLQVPRFKDLCDCVAGRALILIDGSLTEFGVLLHGADQAKEAGASHIFLCSCRLGLDEEKLRAVEESPIDVLFLASPPPNELYSYKTWLI